MTRFVLHVNFDCGTIDPSELMDEIAQAAADGLAAAYGEPIPVVCDDAIDTDEEER